MNGNVCLIYDSRFASSRELRDVRDALNIRPDICRKKKWVLSVQSAWYPHVKDCFSFELEPSSTDRLLIDYRMRRFNGQIAVEIEKDAVLGDKVVR